MCVYLCDGVYEFNLSILQVLQSPELGLQLTEDELAAVHQQLVADPSGDIAYVLWATQAAAAIASAHQDNSDPSVRVSPSSISISPSPS